jgi:hypothetical protein
MPPRLKRGQCIDLEQNEVQALLRLLPAEVRVAHSPAETGEDDGDYPDYDDAADFAKE